MDIEELINNPEHEKLGNQNYGTLAGNGGQDDDPRFFSVGSVSSDPKTANSEPSYGRKRLKMVITMI